MENRTVVFNKKNDIN